MICARLTDKHKQVQMKQNLKDGKIYTLYIGEKVKVVYLEEFNSPRDKLIYFIGNSKLILNNFYIVGVDGLTKMGSDNSQIFSGTSFSFKDINDEKEYSRLLNILNEKEVLTK